MLNLKKKLLTTTIYNGPRAYCKRTNYFFSVHFLTGTLRTANLTFGGHSLTTYKSNMNGLSMHRKSLILEFLAHYFIANFCLGIFGTLFHSISLRILVIIFRLPDTRHYKPHSWFETTLDYKTRISGSKIEEFSCLVHKCL